MGLYGEAVERIYVAYFNRPADAFGLVYWEDQIANAGGDASAVTAAFAGSAEYQRAYAGMDTMHIVAQVYHNLFGRDPDLAGLNFWSDALVHKQVSVDNMVTMISGAAQGSDKVAFDSKAAAAGAFTDALNTVSLKLAYAGDYANMIGKIFISSVADADSLREATSPESLKKIMDGLGNMMTATPSGLEGASGGTSAQPYTYHGDQPNPVLDGAHIPITLTGIWT